MIHAGGLADPSKPSLRAPAATGRPEGGDSTRDPAASEPTDLPRTRKWAENIPQPSTEILQIKQKCIFFQILPVSTRNCSSNGGEMSDKKTTVARSPVYDCQ